MKHLPIAGKILKVFCIVALIATVGILAAAFSVQIFLDELPCPLCLLQRAAFASIAIGLLMNLRYGEHTAHWAIVIISACTGMAVSLRQICLHITSPAGFGSAFFGFHMYTWAFLGFALATVGSAFILLVYSEKIWRYALAHTHIPEL